ncbi:MAG: tetratricopeptide repeat protein [Actinobacteria bacterium]|nr:tetratricopeptide repeat protein [Actinomycetota bacterium]
MHASNGSDWQQRVDSVWGDESLSDGARIAAIAELASQLPASDPRGPFELGGAYDSAGFENEAAAQYERAIGLGLAGGDREQLDIQYASTLRNLGRLDEAIALLRMTPSNAELADERLAFLALALHSAGRADEAVAVAIEALIPHLSKYQRSLTNYAAVLRPQHEPERPAR